MISNILSIIQAAQIDAKTCILALSALLAFYSIHRNTIINRRRATVDLVLQQKNDAELLAANKVVNPLLTENNITRFAGRDLKNAEETKAILRVLNNYEFISSGIKEKAFDEKLYQRMRHGMVVRDWNSFEAFVCQFRKDRDHSTLFQEFEWLANRFKKRPLKKYRRGWFGG